MIYKIGRRRGDSFGVLGDGHRAQILQLLHEGFNRLQNFTGLPSYATTSTLALHMEAFSAACNWQNLLRTSENYNRRRAPTAA